jgi:hypothetical protein
LLSGFIIKSEEWFVSGGFRKINSFPADFITKAEINSMLIKEGKSEYIIKGPGAGAEPTALAMVSDANDLLKYKKTA